MIVDSGSKCSLCLITPATIRALVFSAAIVATCQVSYTWIAALLMLS